MLRGGGGSEGIFSFGSCVEGTLSSPDTKLIMPLQLVAERSVSCLTRCSGPADPGGEIIAKLQKNPPKQEADSCALGSHWPWKPLRCSKSSVFLLSNKSFYKVTPGIRILT